MDLAAELVGHLLRLKVWSLASLAVGALFLLGDRRSGFGAMTVGWAAVNLAIVWASGRGAPPADADGFRRLLLFNLGLNLVWIAIGVLMMRNRTSVWVSQAGLAMVIQGVVLQVLDILLYVRTSR